MAIGTIAQLKAAAAWNKNLSRTAKEKRDQDRHWNNYITLLIYIRGVEQFNRFKRETI